MLQTRQNCGTKQKHYLYNLDKVDILASRIFLQPFGHPIIETICVNNDEDCGESVNKLNINYLIKKSKKVFFFIKRNLSKVLKFYPG